MKAERHVLFPLVMLMLVIISCSLPSKVSTEDRIRTQIAQTRTADPNSVALVQEEQGATSTATPEGPGPSRTLTATQEDKPSGTPTATLTSTASENQSDPDCNIATFIKDVTIPDGTEMSAGETFTKTWRLKNLGTCTWTTGYAVVFVSGEQMGASEEIFLSKKVPPGESVDISIEMTAPGTKGDYRGNWKLRSSDGVIFGLTTGKAFYVEITVK